MSRWEPDAAGRMVESAIALFAEQGYDDTTVAEIAARAGLTKRTFFRYFSDKREVLFRGATDLQDAWLAATVGAPPEAGPLAAAAAGFDVVAELFAGRHRLVGVRAAIVAAHPDLQERELIKLQSLAASIESALRDRGCSANAAALAAQAGVTVFHVAFARWVEQDDPAALRRLMAESLEDLRSVVA